MEQLCSPDELRTLFLFEKLTDDQLGWLCQRGRVEVYPAGPVYTEGDPATHFYVLLEGTVVLSRRVGGDDIEAGRTSQPGVYAGAWQAYLGDQVPQRYPSSMRVTGPSRFFVLDAGVFAELMNDWFPMAVHLLGGGVVYRTNLAEVTGQRERLLAPVFVAGGLDVAWLEQSAAAVDQGTLDAALRWLACADETELLMNEIEDATTRISALVGAAKQYSQLDRAPHQVVDVHELLDSTLTILAGKIPPGIRVVREYDRSLPAIPAYAAELNQVWTNLIDNALSAMGQTGVLTVRTGRDQDRDQVVVDIGDTGPGVPPEIRDRIFEPFFTTKPVGQGTGLGLDISWRIVAKKHHGAISVESVPGDTRFRVWLPASERHGGNTYGLGLVL